MKRRESPTSFRELAGDNKVHPVMRELASAAAWKNLSLSWVARRINEEAGYGIAASNVRRYFTAGKPHPETVDLLTKIIGLNARHVKVASGEKLSDSEYATITRRLEAALTMRDAAFEEGAVKKAQSTLERLDTDDRVAVLNSYELQCQRADAWMLTSAAHIAESEFDENDPFVFFARALHQRSGFDLLARLQRRSAHEDVLWRIWVDTAIPPVGSFTSQEAEAIIATALGLLRLRGVDTRPMELHFRRERASLQRAEALALTYDGGVGKTLDVAGVFAPLWCRA